MQFAKLAINILLGAIAMIPTLKTERLFLRPFTIADATMVQSLAGAFEIADTTLTIPHPYEDGLAESWIKLHLPAFEAMRAVTFAITLGEEKSVMGAISLMSIESGHQAELGYWIGVPFWGKGYCSEAAKRIIEYSFFNLGLERVHAGCLTRNPASAKVIEKNGFSLEGLRREHIKKWGVYEDLNIYGLLKNDWMATNK